MRLAVRLLADRRGVIDLDLPISGSLNDPQFRIGPVIGKIILNLIGKALTSPSACWPAPLVGVRNEQRGLCPRQRHLEPGRSKTWARWPGRPLVDRPAPSN